MHGRTCSVLVCLLLFFLPACGDPTSKPAPSAPERTSGESFDAAATGTVAGTIRWQGSVPAIAPFRALEEPLVLSVPSPAARDWPNPNAPRVDPGTLGLSSAIVFLRGIDARKARPWNHPAVRVELRDQTFHVRQGTTTSNIGFVRAGDAVEFVSRDERLHFAQARGAAFFALTLPRPDKPRSRRLQTPGVVELLSGSGFHWMRAYLHVADHPYFARPDARGAFRLEQVPTGEYDLVAWHPAWRVAVQERNADLGRVQQIRFAPPHEVVARVHVTPGETARIDLVFPQPR
jgi:hypothetical protein